MKRRALRVAGAGLAILAGMSCIAGAESSPPGGLGLRQNRDRLLDTLARQKGGDNSRCSVWNSMGSNQKGVFLTITDLFFGSWLYPATKEYTYRCVTYSDVIGGTPHRCGIYNPADLCGGCGCDNPDCYAEPVWTGRYLPRQDYQLEKMLDHVSKIYEMAANNPGCGHDWDTIYDRFWFQADDALLYALRNIDCCAPNGWGRSQDIGGPHSPFTQRV